MAPPLSCLLDPKLWMTSDGRALSASGGGLITDGVTLAVPTVIYYCFYFGVYITFDLLASQDQILADWQREARRKNGLTADGKKHRTCPVTASQPTW